MKPFLILQLRPEDAAADGEYLAFLDKGGIASDEVLRIRLDQSDLPGDLDLDRFSGVIVGGGPGCVSDDPAKKPPLEARIEAAVLSLMPEIVDRDLPFLGCCYGIGILGAHLGGEVSKARYGEPVGVARCTVTPDGRGDPLLDGCAEHFDAFVGHKEAMQALPVGCTHLVSSPTCPFQMVRHGANVYATQFHPEADGDVFETRIRLYRDHGYFPPEDADAIIARCHAAQVEAPVRILRNFVARFRV